MSNETYVPYGEEWKKEMSKLPKNAIIEIASGIGKEKEDLKEAADILSLPTLPDWDEVIKWIDDSRFTTMDGRDKVREGARIMYDRLYSMLSKL